MGEATTARVALITGGTRRLGKAIAQHLALQGWRLILTFTRDEKSAAQTRSELEAHGAVVRIVQSPSGSPEATRELLEEVKHIEGRLDFLLHNVGRYVPQDPLRLSPADWERTITTNLNGGFYYAHAGRELLAASRGLLGFMGFTGLSSLRSDPETMDYTVSKVGLLSLMKSLATAYGPLGVRVAMVSPGQIDNSIDLPNDARTIPLGRFGRAEDLCQAWDYLLAADYVTGVDLEVAGGFRL